MAKWKPGPESETLTLLKYFHISSLDTPDNRTEEESPLSPVCSHPSIRSPTARNSTDTSAESPVITEQRPSTESSCTVEVNPLDSVITTEDMESEDSRPAEHPATSDATAAGSRSVGQLKDIS